MNICRDYCRGYKALIAKYVGGKNKRCSICDLFLFYPGRYCPCCGTLLRSKNHLYGKNRRDIVARG